MVKLRKPRTFKKCEVCHKEFSRMPYLMKEQRFCSNNCANKFLTPNRMYAYKNNWKKLIGIKRSLDFKKKISEAKKKTWKKEDYRKLKLEQMKKVWEFVRKNWHEEGHPNWQGGLSHEKYDNRKIIQDLKKTIKRRDNFICMLCNIHGEKKRLDTHHINYDKYQNFKENLITLCHPCHCKTGFNRQHWTNFFQSLLSEKYGYKYGENQEVIINLQEKAND